MTQQEAINWLAELINRIDTQDSRHTAKPVQFLLQVKRHIYGEQLSDPDFTKYAHPRYDYHDYDSPDEIIADMIENGWDKEDAEKERNNIREYQGQHYWDTEQVFLTEEGVKRHLEQNRHNLFEPRDYVIHAFRNPEMKELYDAIRTIVSFEEWRVKTVTEIQHDIDKQKKLIHGDWPKKEPLSEIQKEAHRLAQETMEHVEREANKEQRSVFKEESKRIMQEAVQKLTEDARKS